jgi:DNA polymerase (family X)
MITDNDYIAEKFSLLAKLMDIHGENSFKIKSYSIAAFTIEKLPQPLSDMPPSKFTSIKGIGDAIGKKIQEIINTGELSLLRRYIENTPPGIIEMLQIKGIGPKKIATIWKEMGIESIGELLYACQENRLLLYKGFGEKTQNSVRETIEFYLNSQGSRLYADVEAYAAAIQDKLETAFPADRVAITGEFSRHLEIIDQLQWVTTTTPDAIRNFFGSIGFTETAGNPDSSFIESLASPGSTASPASQTPASSSSSGSSSSAPHVITRFKGPEAIPLEFIHTSPEAFATTLLETSSSPEFLHAWQQHSTRDRSKAYRSEEEIFSAASLHFIPPFLREQPAILEQAAKDPLPAYLQPGDIRGIIHSHSDWSDGSNTLEQMARGCMEKGFEYLVISDHSKSAFYANGLKEDRIAAQHQLIDELNRQLAPFVIFKSIEADILNDGALDYSGDILSTFDLVIASVHSNLKMNEEKAMTRVLKAIENPYTTILGHPTGRLLLSRPGYPLDHRKIIDACAANKVVIELNAHPRRLDIDWRWIGYAREKEVLIAVDPDAHSIEGMNVVKYGALAAQKGGLTKEGNLSSFGLAQFKEFLATRRKARGI